MEWVDLLVSAMDLPDGFSLPDWDAPIDVQSHLDRIPADATSKGMFVQAMVGEVRRVGKELSCGGKFVSFKDYPLGDVLDVIIETGQLLHPEATQREQLRRVARLGYSCFTESMIGKVIFGMVRGDVGRIFRLAGRALPHAISPGKLETEMLDDNSALIRASDIYLIADCFAPGIAEGALQACGRQAVIAMKSVSDTEIELWIHWA